MRSTGHIRERSPGAFELRYTVGIDMATGKRKVATATVHGSRKDAERELRRRLVAADRGEQADPTKMTAGQWFDRWLAIAKPEISPATHDHYRRAIDGYLKPRLGHVGLARLSRADVQQLFSDLADAGRKDRQPGPLAVSTRKQLFRVLSICLGRAVDLNLININVAQVMRRRMPKAEAAPDFTVLTAEQSTVLLDAARGSALFAPILLALSTGCRRGEVAALTWRNVDLGRGTITFAMAAKQIGNEVITGPTKSRKPRVVSLGDNALEELRGWKREQAEQLFRLGVRQAADTLVCTQADGSRLRPNALTTAFWRLAMRLGFDVHYHSLRHGHVTALLIAGVHPKVAQERLGHHSVAFTLDRYAHTIAQLHDDAAKKIDSIFVRGRTRPGEP
jgi:integrase